MYRETEKIGLDKYNQSEYKMKSRDIDLPYVINKLGELEDFVESIQSFYNMSNDYDLLAILEFLFVFRTSYINLSNKFDELTTKYIKLLEKNSDK